MSRSRKKINNLKNTLKNIKFAEMQKKNLTKNLFFVSKHKETFEYKKKFISRKDKNSNAIRYSV